MTDEEPKTKRCRAGSEGQRCSFHGTREELRDHADEMGHPRCIMPKGRDSNGEPRRCATALAWYEQQACDCCVQRTRDDLDAIAVAYAHLERTIQQAARRGIAWDALALAADGSLAGLKPFRETVLPEVEIERQELVGEKVTHPGYTELRRVKRPGDTTVPPTGREHFDDHWKTDPLSVLAFLEHHERDWRHELGHGPAVGIATVAGCLSFLRDTHLEAARTHPGFDDYATEVRELRSRLEHVVGLADDPAKGAPCACGTLLRRDYGQDDWTCPGCGAAMTNGEYLWKLRLSTYVPGFVSVAEAARDVGRPMRTVQTWARLAEVPVLCIRVTRRVVVELAGVRARAEEVAVRERRAS